jgi:hypothetical protein
MSLGEWGEVGEKKEESPHRAHQPRHGGRPDLIINKVKKKKKETRRGQRHRMLVIQSWQNRRECLPGWRFLMMVHAERKRELASEIDQAQSVLLADEMVVQSEGVGR